MQHKIKAFALAACSLAMLGARTAVGDTFYVATDGKDGADGSSETPFATIAAGVTAAAASSAPRKVIVRTGEYKIDTVIEITASMTIESETGEPTDVIIDGQGATPLVKWTDANRSTLSGLTLANGYCKTGGSASAGVYMEGGTIANCVVRGCLLTGEGTEDALGAGIFVRSISGHVSYVEDTVVSGNVVSNAIPAAANKSSKGGGIYLTGTTNGVVRGCTVENNIAWLSRGTNDQNNPQTNLCRGGGICSEAPGCEILDCKIRDNCATNATPNGKTGCGGGVYASNGATVSNCLVYANMASAQGGGVCADTAIVTHCTITNNVINAVKSAGSDVRGAGVLLSGTNPQCRNSVVAGNRLQGASSIYSNSAIGGGGGIGITGESALVANCAVTNNSAHLGGAFVVYGAAGAVISNCLVSANSGSSGGGVMYYWRPQGVLMTDSIVVDNVAGGDGGAVCFGKTAGTNCGGLAFRSCFISRNYLTAGDGLFNSAVAAAYFQPLTIEYCTLAANTSNWFVVSTDAKTSVSNVFCRGNVILGTRRRVSPYNAVTAMFGPTGAEDVFSATTNAWYNFTESNLVGFSTDLKYGNFNTLTAADFADAANGDYRLSSKSAARNAGGVVQGWMGNGAKSGPFDMGDGTMDVVCDANGYGVTLVRREAFPRLSGSVPDAGCFEYQAPSGLSIIFR
jgi:hypothetical protein